MSHENRSRHTYGEGSGGTGRESLPPDRDDGSAGDRLEGVLRLGLSLLDVEFGAVIRVEDEDRDLVATAGGLPSPVDPASVFGDYCRGVLAASAAVTAPEVGLAETADVTGCFLGRRLPVDTEFDGALCFVGTTPRADGFDGPVERDLASLARLAADGFGPGTGEDDGQWDDTTFNETLLDTVQDALYAATTDGRLVQWNDRLETVTGYDTAAIGSMTVSDFVAEPDRADVAAAMADLEAGDVATVEARLETADGKWTPYETRCAPVTDDGEVVGFVGVGRDVSAHREYERTLAALHDTTRELLPAETEDEIAEKVVAATRDTLEGELACLFLFDEEANTLEPVARTDTTDAIIGEPPSFGSGDGVAWRVFMRGEAAVFDDVGSVPEAYNPETPVRSELIVPLGEHGVLIVGDTERGVFDDRTVEVAGTLAANAEAALDNVARKRELAARDETLERQHRRLERLDDVNERIRRIGHDIVGVDDRDELKRLVVERLVDSGLFEFAWIGVRHDGGMRVRASAGRGEGYVAALEAVEDPGDPVWRASERCEPVVVDRVASEFRSEPWRSEALNRDFQSVVAVPLVHEGVPHGVLGLYAGSPDVFDGEMLTVFRELGEIVGQAIATAKRRHAHSTGDRLELVVHLSECPVAALAVALEATVRLTGAVSRADDRTLLYGTASTDANSFEHAVERTPAIGEGRVVATGDGRVRFELATERESVAETVRGFGGDLGGVEVDGEGARLVTRLPADADVRGFVSALESDFGDATVLAQRTEPDSRETGPLEPLTDRQREALQAAYHAGFFEWPRESDGGTVAEDLGVAQPTFVEHLRRAESNLLEALLGDRD